MNILEFTEDPFLNSKYRSMLASSVYKPITEEISLLSGSLTYFWKPSLKYNLTWCGLPGRQIHNPIHNQVWASRIKPVIEVGIKLQIKEIRKMTEGKLSIRE